jgi:hypothetical protein
MPSGRLRLPLLATLLSATSFLPPTARAAAQSAPPQGRTWITYAVDQPLPHRFALLVEAQGRFYGATFDHTQQKQLRVGLDYSPVAPLRLAGGWGFVSTDPEVGGGGPDVPEHRAWGQAQLARAVGRVNVSNRLRYERRWIGADAPADTADVAEGGGGGVPKWVRAQRVRYQLRGTIPVGNCLPRLRCYVAASNEFFAGIATGDGRALSPEQNRAALGVGTRILPSLRVELGYLNQSDVATGGSVHVRTHALTLNVTTGGKR